MTYKKENTLSETVVKELLDMINSSEDLKPGSKLPNENELANTLKVSRGTLREAIKILSTQNVLYIKRGKGTFVSENYNTNDNLNINSLNSIKITLKDLMEMRLILEPEIAYRAALRATENEIKAIMHYGNLVEAKIMKGVDRMEEERLFHITISKAAHNEFMKKLSPIINKAIFQELIVYTAQNESYEDSISDHRAIMHFINTRNPEGAKNAMRLHIIRMIENLKLDNQI